MITLLPFPLYALFGTGERIAVWANLAALGAACAAVYAAARALWPEHPRRDGIAALAAALTALIPLLYGLSRVFFVEPLLTALVAAAIWRVAAASKDRRDGARLGALLGFGLLAKILFPLYLAGPVWLRRRELKPHAKAALLLGGALAATWYAFNLPYIVGFAWSAGFGKIAADYAGEAAGLTGRLSAFAAMMLGALSAPLAIAIALVCAAASRRGRLDAGIKLALAWAAPVAIIALSPNQESRFTAPALPALALLAARAAMSFGSRSARTAAAAALLGAGAFVFVRQTFLLPVADALPWCGAPSVDPGWDRGAVIDAVGKSGGAVAALALEHPRLNANNLSSLAASRGLAMRFVSLGYAQTSLEAALIRLKDKDADRLILINGLSESEQPHFLNRVNADVAGAVATGRLPARELARAEPLPGVTAVVYGLAR